MLSLALAAWVAGQGQALQMSYPAEPGLTGVTVRWSGHPVPFTLRGDHWLATVGVDLDSRPGDHAVDVTFTYEDGRTRVVREPVTVAREQYPTTELQVEERYVELRPEDQARADREAAETSAIYDTFTPERYWSDAFEVPVRGAKDGRNFGHRRVFNGQPRAPHSGRRPARHDGHADLRGEPRPRRAWRRISSSAATPSIIDHGYGLFTTYLHLSKIDVAVGEVVERASSSASRGPRAASRGRTCIGACGSSTPASTRSR